MREEHFRRLERMYVAAKCNVYYQPRIAIREGEAEVVVPVRADFHHSADAVHGSVYFKVLDDAAFFAANSVVEEVLVLTSTFYTHFLAPISTGELRASGRVVHRSGKQIVSEAVATADTGQQVARGSGVFVTSKIPLGPALGYW